MLLWRRITTAFLTAATMSSAAIGTADAGGPAATIRHTEYGIPHIVAGDYRSLGFGQGYAAAQDNLCAIADTAITTRGRRSQYLGPDAAPTGGLNLASTNLSSDLYFQGLNDSKVVEHLLAQPAPGGPTDDVRRLVRGYAEGVDKFLGEGRITDPACRDAAWLSPITELDIYRHNYALGMIFGQDGAADSITTAHPRAAPTGPRADLAQSGLGSNAMALGSAVTANGRGISLANPHLPWHLSGIRLWQAQLTIPGKLDVSGAGIAGTPLLWIGHTATAAWSGTATDATRSYTLFDLKLVPGSPTTYLVDGKREAMVRREVAVPVRQPDGGLRTVTQPQWWTRYGPVVTRFGPRDLPWTAETAYALADANAGNLALFNTLLEVAKSGSAGGMIDAVHRTQGLPWMNILATDDRGRVAYTQTSAIPHVTDEQAARCNTALGRQTFPQSGLAVLDGSRTSCAWGSDRDAVRPGIFGPSSLPSLQRNDYFANSNDSYWLLNPRRPQTAQPRIVGAVEDEQNMRTREGFSAIEDRLAVGKFDGQSTQDLMFSDRSLTARLTRDDVVKMCRTMPGLAAACNALASWDGRFDPGSRGALLFDRFWDKASEAGSASLWKVAFDPRDPVHTPNTLDVDRPAVRQALADAVAELTAAKVPFDAPYGDNHYVVRDGKRIPLGGATPGLGVYNSVGGGWDPQAGYTEMQHGGTYLHVVAFTGTGCPSASTLLTYSQSANTASPHYADQTELYSQRRWVTERFCEKDILASPVLDVITVRG